MKKSWVVIVIMVGAVTRAQSSEARSKAVVPSHFSVGDQYYDASVLGIRSYLESIRSTDAGLHAKLVPDLEQLESRAVTAGVVLAAGVVAGAGLVVYGAVTRGDCSAVGASDPNFATKVAAWDACNQNNDQRTMTFAMIGLGTLLAGSISALVIAPKRSDYFDFMNRHNAASPRPMRLQLGYDPTRRFALAGAVIPF